MMSNLHTVTLYGKKECCLCDEAMAELHKIQATVPFVLEKVDIASRPELLQRYGNRIPIIFVDGVEVFQYRVRNDHLTALLADEVS